jgi:hypothetical protein
MIDTGPLPAVKQESSSAERMASLVMMGAPFTRGIWRSYSTADAVIDRDKGILFIACDPEPASADWAAIVGLIRAVGYDNGTWPHSDDPGEPFHDALSDVWTWELHYVRLRYPWTRRPGLPFPLSGRGRGALAPGPGCAYDTHVVS